MCSADAHSIQANIAVHTLDKRAGFEDAGVVLERPLWACIGAVPEILRVIIPGLAQYHSAVLERI